MQKTKKIIIGILSLGTVALATGITVPLIIKKSSSTKTKEKTAKEKFMDLSKDNHILEDETIDLDLSTLSDQNKILTFIKEKSSFLTKAEKDSIKLVTKVGTISFLNPLEIILKATFSSEESEFVFKFTRKTTNQEKFEILKEKFGKAQVNRNLILSNANNLDLANAQTQIKVKEAVIAEINRVNDIDQLTTSEINAITITTTSGTIDLSINLPIIIKISFNAKVKEYTFNFKRTKTIIEIIKNKKDLKNHFKIAQNLNVQVPKASSSSYDSDSKIFLAIKSALELRREITNFHSSLITKKLDSSIKSSVPSNSESAIDYEITIDETNYILKVKQSKHASRIFTRVWKMKNLFMNEMNTMNILNRIDRWSQLKTDVLEGIRHIAFDLFGRETSLLLIKKKQSLNVPLNSIPYYDSSQNSINYEITIDKTDITLKIKKGPSGQESGKYSFLYKVYYKFIKNNKITLPKNNYVSDSEILAEIKKKNGDIQWLELLIKKQGESNVTSVASHGENPTSYWITIFGKDIELKLNQAA